MDNNDKVNLKRRAIQKIEILPSIPAALQKIIEVSADPTSSALDMQTTIEKDQSISAAILKLANSAYYGYARQVDDIKQAIIVIGFNTAVSVAVSISVLKTLDEQIESTEFDLSKFWEHTIFTGEAARLVAQAANYPLVSKAYVFGLLHDIGKIVMFFIEPQSYEDAVFEARTMNHPLYECEFRTFGFDHQEAGSWLAEKWKLPKSIISAIAHHHSVDSCESEFAQEAYIANIANYITKSGKFGLNVESMTPRFDDKAFRQLKLNSKILKETTQNLEKKRKEVETFLELIL